MQSIDSIETYAYGTRKDLGSEKEENKCNNIKSNTKMINVDNVTKENIKEHDPNLPQITNHPYRTLIIGGSRSGKTNSLFNLISQQADIDKIYLYTKDPYAAKYQFSFNKRESSRIKNVNKFKAFI